MSMPKFSLGQTQISDEEFNKARSVSGGKGFAPGNYDLVIKNVQYHKNRDTGEVTCRGDKTWVNVAMELHGADGRMKKIWLQVPFVKHTYSTANGEITYPFAKLVEFMAAIGEPLTSRTLGEVVGRYFSTEAALANLEGLDINVDIGFKGPYVKFVSETDFRIMIDGEEYSEGGKALDFKDADSAIAYAAENLGKVLERWPEILKFNPAPVREMKKQATTGGWD